MDPNAELTPNLETQEEMPTNTVRRNNMLHINLQLSNAIASGEQRAGEASNVVVGQMLCVVFQSSWNELGDRRKSLFGSKE